MGIPSFCGLIFGPYGFYDVGKVWNADQGSESGSSAGAEIRIDSGFGASANFLIAEPLSRAIEDPSNGNGKVRGICFKCSTSFRRSSRKGREKQRLAVNLLLTFMRYYEYKDRVRYKYGCRQERRLQRIR